MVSPHKGKPLTDSEFTMAARIRLGCAGPDEPAACANCDGGILGRAGTHAMLCAKGPSTRGHNAVRDEIFAMASGVDAGAELEPTGLVPARPALRPADILISASGLTGRLAALGAGIANPAAAVAGADKIEAMRECKCARVEPHAEALERQGIAYRPITLSCFGRPRPDSLAAVRSLARRTARRRGTGPRVEERRMMARISVEIWRRAARMVLQCWPCMGADDGELEEPLDPSAGARAGHAGNVDPGPPRLS